MTQLDTTYKDYPNYLTHLNHIERKNAPESLFCEGDISLLTTGVRVSIVGSRKASEFGIRRATIITQELIKAGVIVVSGLAEGIDTVAHTTAIKYGGRTIAVLGTPLNKTFPAKNKDLLAEIKINHLAVSQFKEGFSTGRASFPQRNRTMALISDATIIVEASDKSGTRHQGWEALRLGRTVYIMQNVIDDPSVTWTREMLRYGAQALTRDFLEDSIYGILPSFVDNEVGLF